MARPLKKNKKKRKNLTLDPAILAEAERMIEMDVLKDESLSELVDRLLSEEISAKKSRAAVRPQVSITLQQRLNAG